MFPRYMTILARINFRGEELSHHQKVPASQQFPPAWNCSDVTTISPLFGSAGLVSAQRASVAARSFCQRKRRWTPPPTNHSFIAPRRFFKILSHGCAKNRANWFGHVYALTTGKLGEYVASHTEWRESA